MKRSLLYGAIFMFLMFSCDDPDYRNYDNVTDDTEEAPLTRAIGDDEPKTCGQCFPYYIQGIPYTCPNCGVRPPITYPEEGPKPEMPVIGEPADNEFTFILGLNYTGTGTNTGMVYLDKDGGTITGYVNSWISYGDLPTSISYPNGYFWIVTYSDRNADFFIGRSGGFVTSGNEGIIEFEISRGPNASAEDKYITFVFNCTVDYCMSSPSYSESGTFHKEYTVTVIQPGGSLLPEVPIVMPPCEDEEEPAGD